MARSYVIGLPVSITIEDDGRQTVLSQSDTAMSADFGKLLAWLQRHPDK